MQAYKGMLYLLTADLIHVHVVRIFKVMQITTRIFKVMQITTLNLLVVSKASTLLLDYINQYSECNMSVQHIMHAHTHTHTYTHTYTHTHTHTHAGTTCICMEVPSDSC